MLSPGSGPGSFSSSYRLLFNIDVAIHGVELEQFSAGAGLYPFGDIELVHDSLARLLLILGDLRREDLEVGEVGVERAVNAFELADTRHACRIRHRQGTVEGIIFFKQKPEYEIVHREIT